MTLEEIKVAVRAGKTVCWQSRAYVVVHTPAIDQWLIQCTLNGSCSGLTWADGVTVNGEPQDFFVAD